LPHSAPLAGKDPDLDLEVGTLDSLTIKTRARMADMAVRLTQAGAGHHMPLIRAAMAGVLRFPVVPPGGRMPLRLLELAQDRHPLTVLLADDGDAPPGPAGLPQTTRLLRWARAIMLHTAGGEPKRHATAAQATVLTGRLVLAETDTAHEADELAARVAPCTATLRITVPFRRSAASEFDSAVRGDCAMMAAPPPHVASGARLLPPDATHGPGAALALSLICTVRHATPVIFPTPATALAREVSTEVAPMMAGNLARHGRSPHAPSAFAAVNCAVLPHLETLCRRSLSGSQRIGAEWVCSSLHCCGQHRAGACCTGIEPADVVQLLELLIPLDSYGGLLDAIAWLERGDVEGGLSGVRAAFAEMTACYDEGNR
jgi:hypothetical protein